MGSIELWDATSGKILQTLQTVLQANSSSTSYAKAFTFSPDGKVLALNLNRVLNRASASESSSIELWEVSSGKSLQTLQGYSVTFSPDSQTFVTGNENGIKLWEVSTGKLLRTFSVQEQLGVTRYDQWAISPNGKMLAVSCTTLENYNTPYPGSSVSVRVLGESVKLWELSSGKELHNFKFGASVNFATFSPDSKTLAIGNSDSSFRLWEVSSGEVASAWKMNVSFVVFSLDGKTLFGITNGGINVWDMNSGKMGKMGKMLSSPQTSDVFDKIGRAHV